MEKRAWEIVHHLGMWGVEKSPAQLLGDDAPPRIVASDYDTPEAFRAAVRASRPPLIGPPEDVQEEEPSDG